MNFSEYLDSWVKPLFEADGEPQCPPGYKFDKKNLMCVPKTPKDDVRSRSKGKKDMEPSNMPGFNSIGSHGQNGAPYAYEEGGVSEAKKHYDNDYEKYDSENKRFKKQDDKMKYGKAGKPSSLMPGQVKRYNKTKGVWEELNFFNQLIERKGEKAHKDAVAMGLKYKGFGYWADPNTGEAKYKTVNDQLVPVEGDVESEKWEGDEADEMQTMGGEKRQGMQLQRGSADDGAAPGGGGENIGTAEPGEELALPEKGWEGGPEGNTCVGAKAQKPGEVPYDVFVGKTNEMGWVAGPDGSSAVDNFSRIK